MRRLTHKEFVERAICAHGCKYEYMTAYNTTNDKIKIYCKECDKIFFQRARAHLEGQGCPNCCNIKRRMSNEEFLIKARRKHGNKYEYLDSYVLGGSKIRILCKACNNVFEQRPSEHLYKYGCPFCGHNKRLTKEDFIKRSIEIHGDLYSYPDNYLSSFTKTKIYCKKCKKYFRQIPANHMRGSGCPVCRSSFGEKVISAFLDRYRIEYVREKKFSDCKNPITKRKLSFDFYLYSIPVLIEYDGSYHYLINKRNTKDALVSIKFRDKIKTKYAIRNNIKLIRISYKDNKEIDNILCKELGDFI